MSSPTTTTTTSNPNSHRQIPIVCPGHTRPLAELQFCTTREEVSEEEEKKTAATDIPKTVARTFLVSACHDKVPMLRDGITGDWIGSFIGHKGAVWSCKLDPCGFLAATASGDFSVKLWDAITGKELTTFTQHRHIVKSVDFSPDSKSLATGGHEGIVRIYDLADWKRDPLEIHVQTTKDSKEKIKISKCLWLDDNTVLSSGSDGAIKFWNISSSKEASLVRSLEVDAEVRDMELCHGEDSDGTTILTVAAGSKVYFFDVPKYELIRSYKMPIHFREEGGASLHPSRTKFIAGGSDLWVRVFDYATGDLLECHKGHHGPIRCVRYAPDGKTFATGSEDGTIRLWKTDP